MDRRLSRSICSAVLAWLAVSLGVSTALGVEQGTSTAKAISHDERQERRDRLISNGTLRDGGKALEQYDVEDLSDRDLQALTENDRRLLKRVGIRYGVSDEGLAWLRGATELCSLAYENFSIGDRGLENLGQLKGLNRLYIRLDDKGRDGSFSTSGIKRLGQLSCLRELQLTGFGFTDLDIKELSPLLQLRKLTISSPRLSDAALQYVANLPNLEELEFTAGELRGSGLAYLSNHHSLKKLTLDARRYDGQGLSNLAELRSLRILSLPGFATISDTTSAELSPLTQLTHLSFRGTGATSCTDETLVSVAKLHDLESLSVGNCRITDQGVAHLSDFNHLRELILAGEFVSLTDSGMKSISSLKDLRKLLLDSDKNEFSDVGIQQLGRLKHLDWLALRSNRITDKGVKSLVERGTLRHLNIEGNKLTDAGRRMASAINRREYTSKD